MSPFAQSKQSIPLFVDHALKAKCLEQAYARRPLHQRIDYLKWTAEAKMDATRQKRLSQMLHELERGDVYMGGAWRRPG